MKHIIFSVLTLVVLITSLSAADRPNIILIMSDDMGYSDIGCFGGEISTPSLDQLAAGGVRFTQFYNTARCCPTRASLLTGLHPHQAGMGHMTGTNHGLPGYSGDLLPTSVTIAEALKPAGYRNYAVGKWHVAFNKNARHNLPLQRGFDRYYGIIDGAANYFDPATLTRDNTPISPFADPEYTPSGEYYLTHAISDNAVKFINEHKAATPDKPFFMYVAFTAAHWPMHAPKDAIAKYSGKYDAGYAAIREARYARQKQSGLISEQWQLSPQANDWDTVGNKAWEARCMEVYAAMISEMDAGVGRIVDSLKATGQYDNTVILFLQDNGACAENVGRQSEGKITTRPDKPTFAPIPKERIAEKRTVTESQTREGYPVIRGTGVMPGPQDTFIAYGRGWANVSNTPYREYKHWVHEGGISTPLIVHSPTKVAEKMRGKFYREPGQLVDLMATCVDLAGATYPAKYNGNEITPVEGTSLVPGFSGESLARTRPLVWEHEGNRAIRDGKWKLVAKDAAGDWELYDVEADRSELNDLASRYPDRVAKMSNDWNEWAVRANVLPWPWDKKNNKDDIKPDKTVGVKLEFDFTQPSTDVVDKSGKNKTITLQGKFEQPMTKSVNAKYFDGSSYIEVDKSPALHCAQTAWSAEATVEPTSIEGVILAYGGSRYGYSLTIQNSKPTFAVRLDGEIFVATSEKPISGKTTLKGVITADKKAELYVNGEKVATKKLTDLITENPVEALQIGIDTGGKVNGEDQPIYKGWIERVIIRREK